MQLVGERVAGIRHDTQVQLFQPETALHIDHPIEFPQRPQLTGSVRLRLSGPAQLVAPPLPEVAHLYHQHADWGPPELSPRGLEITIGIARSYRFSLQLPTPAEILDAAMAHRGCPAAAAATHAGSATASATSSSSASSAISMSSPWSASSPAHAPLN